MADQRKITLRTFHATPKNIILRDLPVATPSAGTTIYLYENHATPKNIILRNPLVADAPAAGGEINATASQTLDNVTQSATAQVIISATASQTIDAVTQSVNADLLVQATAAQTIDAVTLSASADLLVQATASQTLEAVTQAATATLYISATFSQTIEAVTQDATSELGPVPIAEVTERRGGGRHKIARYWRGKFVGLYDDIEWTEWLLAALAGDIAEAPKPKKPVQSRKIRRPVIVEPEPYIARAYPEIIAGLVEQKLETLEALAAQRQSETLAKLAEAAALKKRRQEEDDIAFLFMAA